MTTELEITELRLGLPGGNISLLEKNEKKRVFSEIESDRNSSNINDDAKCQNKNQVLGWPPVCSYRKKNSFNGRETSKMYVKVSMDGAPFLRKVDLSIHKNYSEFVLNLEKLFGCYGIGRILVFLQQRRMMEVLTSFQTSSRVSIAWGESLEEAESAEYILIYEDKDGDWMLMGDVPWEIFTESCRRIRIMRTSDANVIGVRTKDFLKGMSKLEE